MKLGMPTMLMPMRFPPSSYTVIQTTFPYAPAVYASNLFKIFSRTTLLATSAPCCRDIAPTIAKMVVFKTEPRPDASRFSG